MKRSNVKYFSKFLYRKLTDLKQLIAVSVLWLISVCKTIYLLSLTAVP